MKKIVCILLSMLISFQFSGIVSAENSFPQLPDVHYLKSEEFLTYYQNLSQEEQEELCLKITEAIELAEEPLPRAVTKYTLSGGYTIYRQTRNYYCAPACVQSMLHYITGENYSQDELAQQMMTTSAGTYQWNAKNCLNDNQDEYNYNLWTDVEFNNPSEICTYFLFTIYRRSKPVYYSLLPTDSENWRYENSGNHAVNVISIYSDSSRIEVADPGIGLFTGTKYEQTALEAFMFYNGMIW